MPYTKIEMQRAYQRQWLQQRRRAWLRTNGPCRCGSTDRLEVHHVDRHKKVSHRVWSWSEARRSAELAKCVPLCHDCHKIESRKQRPMNQNHGTRAMYVREKCRCAACRKANNDYTKARYRAVA